MGRYDDLFEPRPANPRLAVQLVGDTKPDEAANYVNLAKRYKVPVPLVETFPDEYKARARADDIDTVTRPAPRLRSWLSDTSRAKLALDDVSQLTEIEKAVQTFGSISEWKGPEPTTLNIVKGLAQSIPQAGRAIRAGMQAQMTDFLESVGLITLSPIERADQMRKLDQDVNANWATRPNFETRTASAVYGGVESFLRAIPGLAASVATRSPTPALMAAGGQTQAEAYGKYRARGGTPGESFMGATGEGLVEIATEYLPAKYLSESLGKEGAKAFILNFLKKDALGEQAATLLQDAIDTAVANPDKTWEQYLAERPGAAYETLVATITQAGLMTGLNSAVRRMAASDQQAGDAQAFAENLKAGMTAAATSALRERTPEQFRELMQTMSEGNVYVDGEVLNQLASEVLAQLPPQVQAQVAQAATIGDTVAIPVADVLTVAPGTPLEQTIIEHARATPDALSQADAKAAKSKADELVAEAERVIQQAQDQGALRQSQETVKANIKQQLTATGRFRDAVNEGYATWAAAFYTAYGSRLGMTPEQFYQRYPLRVLGQAPARQGEQVMDQSAPAPETPEFKAWFGDSKVVDADGKPLVVYHGTTGDFDVFRDDIEGRAGFYFTSDKAFANSFAEGADANVMPVHLSISNPADLRRGVPASVYDALESQGYSRLVELYESDPQDIWEFFDGDNELSEALKRAGYDGMRLSEPTGRREVFSWVAFRPEQIKSAIGNRGTFDPGSANILEQRGEQRPGKPVPAAVDAVSNVNAAFELANGQQFKTNRDLKLALQERVLEALKAAKVNLEDFNAGAEQYLVRVALMDAEIALETNPNAVGWYNEKVTKALRLVALVHPEIQTDPQAKFAFVWAMAVTSNGLKVDKNFELAEVAYSTFKSTGKMPTDIQAGQAQAAINNGLALFNEMLAKHGFEALQSFMTTKATVKEIQNFSGLEVGGENLTTEVYGSAILGPKIGNGFFSNLYGRFEQLTMDRWLMRTWGRWTGTLIETNPEQVRAKRVQLRALIQGLDKDQKKAFEAIIKRKLTVGDIDAVALAIWEASQKPINRARMAEVADATDAAGQARLASIMGTLKKGQKRTSFGDELRKVGNALTKYNDGQKEAPSGPPERNRIRKVFAQALAQLQQRHPALTMSDLQALLWYPEKRLYDAAKEAGEGETGYEDDAAPDYANAAAKLAREKGVPEEDIARTIKEVDSELRAADRAAGAGRTAGREDAPGQTAAGGVRDAAGVRGSPGVLEQPDGVLNQPGLEEALQEQGVVPKTRMDAERAFAAGDRVFVLHDQAEEPTEISSVKQLESFTPDQMLILPRGVLDQGQQQPRGTFNPQTLELVLNPNANLSTWFHETGHFFLEVMADIASQPDAPAQIVEDMATFLKWAGVADLATWNSYTLDQKRPYHERWAESVEQYVMEGKAPSVELQPLMRRFAAWLKSVYGSIKQMLQMRGADASPMQLNDDIRRVMDRMLATDEQIAQANEVAGLVPDVEADGEAAERLNKRSMADLKWAVKARDAVIAKLRRQAREIEKGIRAEVTVEVDQMPEMRAKRALDALKITPEHEGMLRVHAAERQAAEQAERDRLVADLYEANPDVKGLKRGQLLAKNRRAIANQVEAHMIEWDKANPKPTRPVNASDQDVATVADSFGYESVDAMLQAIEAFGSRQEAIDGMTQQRMLEEHGDLIDDRAISEAANIAVHNEARARSLATELRTQREMLGARTPTGETREATVRTGKKGEQQTETRQIAVTVNALMEAAKQFAANVVSRTTLRDLKSTAWKHTAAERRAAKRWQEATAAGKTEEAVKAKQDQMLNHAAARAAGEAQDEARKTVDFFRRVLKGNDEKTVEKGRDPDIVNAARAVLAAYGMTSPASKTAEQYLEALRTNDPETHGVVAGYVAQATQNAQPLEALTVEELRGLAEQVQAMWFLAKRSRQMEVAGNLMDIDEAADQIFARLEEIGIPDRVPGEGMAVTKAEERGLFLKQGIAFLRRVEQWAEGMDGKYGGPFLRLIFQPIKDAADRYRVSRIAYRQEFQALVDNLAPIVGDSTIAAPELGYTFGTPGSSAGTAMNEILHAILHTGNESNKKKLLLGRGWATENPDGTLDTSKWDAFIGRLVREGKLERGHYDFAQGVWDLLEKSKPLAQRAHRDAFGRYFAEVTADAFTDPFGVVRAGGYVPAQVDSRLVKDNALRKLAEEENNGMAYAFPQPAKGFTMSRVEGYTRPLMLDLRTLSQHIDKVLLFSHMTVPARDVRKLLTDKKVGQPLDRVQPAALESMLQPWLQRSAQQVVETPVVGAGKWARIPGIIRARAGMALMFANVSNTIQQVTGLSNAAVRVKPAHLMRALAQYVAHPVKTSETVWSLSPYMDDRAKNEVAIMNEQMQDILIRPGIYERTQSWSMRHAYFLQTALDNVLSPIVWSGAYNQALAEGMTDEDAIRFADGTVRQTQGSTLPEDVSRFETGPAYARAFTQFVGYFNMVANTNATALKQIASEVGLKKGAGRAFSVVMLGLMVPIWVAEAIALAFKGGPDDEDKDGVLIDDWLASVFGFGTAKGLLAMIPIAGQAVNSAVTRLDNNPMNDRISLSPGLSLLESALGGNVQTVHEILSEDKEVNARRAVRDAATLVSVFTGLPVYAVARPAGYAAGVSQGKIEPTSAADAARGLITGTPSPESKQR